jgi:2-(1,2-epoxy-1,2-dihydrophenyl)acetyl-CoA isomerase
MRGPVSLTIEEGIAHLRFQRGERMNVIDVEMAEAFEAAVGTAVDTPEVRVVTLSGAGRCFMAGGDLAAFRDSVDRPATARAIIKPVHRALLRLEAARQPSIAAIQGPVAGAGMALALAADLCLAAEGSSLTLAYPRVGAPADCGVTHALTRLVGLRKALEIALLSDPVPADEAARLGLVTRVVSADRLEDEMMALARRLASGAPLALARLRQLLRQAPVSSLADQLYAEEEGFAACASSADFAEALDAFFARRPPVFTGS